MDNEHNQAMSTVNNGTYYFADLIYNNLSHQIRLFNKKKRSPRPISPV